MGYLIDTNHLSPLITAEHRLRTHVLHELKNGSKFYLSPLVLSEFLYGILLLPRAAANERAWHEIASEFEYIHFEAEDAIQAAKLRVALRKRGKQFAFVDAFVAVLALRNNLTLLTTDQDFAAIPTLSIENWLS